MLNYKRFTFNYRHSVFYCISKYYLHGAAYLRHNHHALAGYAYRNRQLPVGAYEHQDTQIYAKITNEKISRDMSALTERLGDKYRLAE